MEENITFRIAGIENIEELVKYRVQFAKQFGADTHEESLNELYNETKKYFEEKIKENTYKGILGYIGDEVVCTAGILMYELPPLIGNKNRIIGHVLNFYTIDRHRNKGYGSKMIDYIKEIATEIGIKTLFLNATKMGENIYRKAGFVEKSEPALILDISK